MGIELGVRGIEIVDCAGYGDSEQRMIENIGEVKGRACEQTMEAFLHQES